MTSLLFSPASLLMFIIMGCQDVSLGDRVYIEPTRRVAVIAIHPCVNWAEITRKTPKCLAGQWSAVAEINLNQ